MSLLSKFPQEMYDFGSYGKFRISDLLTRVVQTSKQDPAQFITYKIGNETPQMISFNQYESVDYYWTILYVNNITNMLNEWPMPEHQLKEYVEATYTEFDPHSTVRHYELFGIIGDPAWLRTTYKQEPVGVTYFEYEIVKNDKKRQIKLISPRHITRWHNEFMKQL
jgi:hypothetical protein